MYAIRLSDISLIVATGLITYKLRFVELSVKPDYALIMTLTPLLASLIFPYFQLYRARRGESIWGETRLLGIAWITTFVALSVILFALQIKSISRLWVSEWFMFGGVTLTLSRIIIRLCLRSLRSRGRNFRRIVILGAGLLGRQTLEQIENAPWTGLKVTAFFDDNEELHGQNIHDIPVMGRLDEVASFLDSNELQQVWITLPMRADERIKSILKTL